MGLIVSQIVARKFDEVILWIPDKEQVEQLKKKRYTQILGQNLELPENIEIISDLDFFGRDDWAFHIAVPSRVFQDTVHSLADALVHSNRYIFNLFTKGLLDTKTRRKYGIYTFSQYIEILLHERNFEEFHIAVTNGPSLLIELIEQKSSFFNIGSSKVDCFDYLKAIFESDSIHCSFTDDVLGMEMIGVAKNPMAIAMGIVSLLPEFGSNVTGELLATGFQEIRDLAMKYGARPDTIMGRSGLADYITTASSTKSRNRQFGQKIVGDLLGGQSQLSALDKIEIFVTPRRFIERESTKWHDNVEGTYALSILIELANEIRIPFSIHRILFEVLTRKQRPDALLHFIQGKPISATPIALSVTKKEGFTLASGKDFQSLLADRIQKHIQNSTGLSSRIKKQSITVLESTLKRLKKSERKGNSFETKKLQSELELWQILNSASKDIELSQINEIIRFYVKEIADSYSPTVRETMLRFIAPIRLLSGGFGRGSMTPYIGGYTEKVKALGSKYNLLYAPTHRSHLDSIEVAYSLFHLGLPVPRYAAGINLMSNPFSEWMLKSLGAYAVDRERTRNTLYLECLTLYSQLMLEQGIPSLVYPEGTRSRTGGNADIKTGLLTTAINAYKNSGTEIVIVPISISYETVPEDNQFCNIPEELGISNFLSKRTNVYVDFSEPLPISEYAHKEDPNLELSYRISKGWAESHRILPNQIVAKILSENDHSVEEVEWKSLIEDFVIRHNGNFLTNDWEEIKNKGKKVLFKRKFIEYSNGRTYSINQPLINYYGNMVPEDQNKKY